MDRSDALSHAYLLAAPPEEGYTAARELAQALVCRGAAKRPCGVCADCRKAQRSIHPDIITVTRPNDEKGKPKREIYVDQIRDIVADACILPNEAETKVYIIRDAGTMNAAAQNALLKILEEPPRFVAFILVADTAGELLETVRSRCVIRYCGGEEDAPGPQAREMAERYLNDAAAGARISLLSFASEFGDLGNAEMQEFVRAVQWMIADMLCGRLPDRRLPRSELLRLNALMNRAEEYLRVNVSTKHVLGLLAVDTPAAGTQQKQ